MAPAFSYQPLPARSIRVIKLLPSRRRTDPLKCSIKHLHLDHVSAQPYEALSYVWGEPTRRWPLDCDGKELLVTKNCHEALVNLRRRFLPRTLWIDAICINQAGTDEATTERNGQVAMMGEIYLKASRVLVWLGPAHAGLSTLFSYLWALSFFNEVEDTYPLVYRLLEPGVRQFFDINHGLLVKHQTSRLLDSLLAILNNPWFERVWTLQEVAFGRKCTIILGRHNLNWESLCRGYLAIPTRGPDRLRETDRLLSRWKLYLQLRGRSLDTIPPSRFRGEHQIQAELQLLAEIRNMKATIPHDRVYSLHALFQVMGLDLPSPDYRKDVAAVFEDATLAYVRCRQSLAIINITPPPAESSGFPSWVPDWLTPGRYNEPLIWSLAEFGAKPPAAAAPTLTQNTGHGKLGVMGKRVGVVTKQVCCPLVGEAGLPRDVIYQQFVEGCLEWRRLMEGLTASGYPSGKGRKKIQSTLLWRFHPAVSRIGLLPWYRWLIDAGGEMPAVDDTVLEELERQRRPRAKWAVYVLDTGYCGVALRVCSVGDVVALLPSLNPLVLRRWKNDGEYRIVTPTYCEGAMNGEMSLVAGELEEVILF